MLVITVLNSFFIVSEQEAAEFNALYQEHKKNPETVKKQLYYSALEEILPDMEIIVGSDSKVGMKQQKFHI